MARVAGLSLALAGCRPAFQTGLDNETGQPLRSFVVRFANGVRPGHGEMGMGAERALMLEERITDIIAIDYDYHGKTCHMDKAAVRRAAVVDPQDIPMVILKGC